MSKKLIKIISICAIAVLIPLVILGVALSVSYNKTVVLSIFDGGDEIAEGTTSKVAIFVENVQQDSNKVTLKKGTEVTVTWEGEGFVFDGWFNGNESEVQGKKAESEKASYTFTLNGNKVLTAIKSYKTYTLNVTYKAGSNEVDTVSYNRGDNGGFGGYNKTRAGYTFVGFKYGENVYTATGSDYIYNGNSLSIALLASPTYSLDVIAVWDCDYEDFLVKYDTDVEENYYVWGIKEDGTELKLKDQEHTFTFDDFDNTGCDLTDSLIHILFGEYTSFVIKDGGNNVNVNLSLDNIDVRVGESSEIQQLVGLSESDPISTWIEAFSIANGNNPLSAGANILITFTFVRA